MELDEDSQCLKSHNLHMEISELYGPNMKIDIFIWKFQLFS